MQVVPQAVGDRALLGCWYSSILVNGAQGLVAVPHTVESERSDDQDGEDQSRKGCGQSSANACGGGTQTLLPAAPDEDSFMQPK